MRINNIYEYAGNTVRSCSEYRRFKEEKDIKNINKMNTYDFFQLKKKNNDERDQYKKHGRLDF